MEATHSTLIYFRTIIDLPSHIVPSLSIRWSAGRFIGNNEIAMECKFRGNYVVETYFSAVVHSNDRTFQCQPLKGQRNCNEMADWAPRQCLWYYYQFILLFQEIRLLKWKLSKSPEECQQNSIWKEAHWTGLNAKLVTVEEIDWKDFFPSSR